MTPTRLLAILVLLANVGVGAAINQQDALGLTPQSTALLGILAMVLATAQGVLPAVHRSAVDDDEPPAEPHG